MSEVFTLRLNIDNIQLKMDIRGLTAASRASEEKFYVNLAFIVLSLVLSVIFLAKSYDMYRRRRKIGNILLVIQWLFNTASYFTLIFYNITYFTLGFSTRISPSWSVAYLAIITVSYCASPLLGLSRLRLFDSEISVRKEILYITFGLLMLAGVLVPGLIALYNYVSSAGSLSSSVSDSNVMLLMGVSTSSYALTLITAIIAFAIVLQLSTKALALRSFMSLFTFNICKSIKKEVVITSRVGETLPCLCLNAVGQTTGSLKPQNSTDCVDDTLINDSGGETLNMEELSPVKSAQEKNTINDLSDLAINEYLNVIRFAESHNPKICPKAAALNYRNSVYDPDYNVSYMSSSGIRTLNAKRLATKSLILLVSMLIVTLGSCLSFMLIPDSHYRLIIGLCLKSGFDSLDYIYVYNFPNILKSI